MIRQGEGGEGAAEYRAPGIGFGGLPGFFLRPRIDLQAVPRDHKAYQG